MQPTIPNLPTCPRLLSSCPSQPPRAEGIPETIPRLMGALMERHRANVEGQARYSLSSIGPVPCPTAAAMLQQQMAA